MRCENETCHVKGEHEHPTPGSMRWNGTELVECSRTYVGGRPHGRHREGSAQWIKCWGYKRASEVKEVKGASR